MLHIDFVMNGCLIEAESAAQRNLQRKAGAEATGGSAADSPKRKPPIEQRAVNNQNKKQLVLKLL